MHRIDHSARRMLSSIHDHHFRESARKLPHKINAARHHIEYKLVDEYLKLYQKWLNKKIKMLESPHDAPHSNLPLAIVSRKRALDHDDGMQLRELKMAQLAINAIIHSQGQAMIPIDEIQAAMNLVLKLKKPLLNNPMAARIHEMACVYIAEYSNLKAAAHELSHSVQNKIF